VDLLMSSSRKLSRRTSCSSRPPCQLSHTLHLQTAAALYGGGACLARMHDVAEAHSRCLTAQLAYHAFPWPVRHLRIYCICYTIAAAIRRHSRGAAPTTPRVKWSLRMQEMTAPIAPYRPQKLTKRPAQRAQCCRLHGARNSSGAPLEETLRGTIAARLLGAPLGLAALPLRGSWCATPSQSALSTTRSVRRRPNRPRGTTDRSTTRGRGRNACLSPARSGRCLVKSWTSTPVSPCTPYHHRNAVESRFVRYGRRRPSDKGYRITVVPTVGLARAPGHSRTRVRRGRRYKIKKCTAR
jgi:hypothetical protein